MLAKIQIICQYGIIRILEGENMRIELRKNVEKLYFNDGLCITEIAKIISIDSSQISKILNKEFKDAYIKEKSKREQEKKSRIYELFFNSKCTMTEIAKELDISIECVSNIIKQHSDYLNEKHNRKQENKKKHIEKTKKYISDKRATEKESKESRETYEQVLKWHEDDSAELSQCARLSTRSAVYKCLSAYNLSRSKKSLVWNNKVGKRPKDMPKNFSLKTF